MKKRKTPNRRCLERVVRPIRLTKMDIIWLQSVIQKPNAVPESHKDVYRRLLDKLNRMFWQLKLPKTHRAMIAKINKTVRQVRAFNATRPNESS